LSPESGRSICFTVAISVKVASLLRP
jgi:hypothetical protein